MSFCGRSYLIALGAVCLGVPAALAPVTGWAEIQEIVVSTRRKNENLQDVPVAVAAFDAESIEKLGITTTEDVMKFVPGVQFDQAFSAADTRISIRGINNTRGRTSVAVLVDGVDASGENVTAGGGSSLLNSRLLDLERVEVVKGPQSALYGRNAFAGAVNYVTKQPSMDGLQINVTADDAANYAIYDLRGSISGPVIDNTLALSLNAGTWKSDGYYDNNNPNDPVANVGLGGGESNGLRLAALWTPTDTLTVSGSVSYSENEFEPRPVVKVGNSNTFYKNGVRLPPGTQPSFTSSDPTVPGQVGGLMNYGQWLGTVTSVDENKISLSRSYRNDAPFQGSSDDTVLSYLKVEWLADTVTFKSRTSLINNDAFLHEDVEFQDGVGTPISRVVNNVQVFSYGSLDNDYLDETETQYYEQEFTLESSTWERGRWLVGVNGFREHTKNQDKSLYWYNAPNIAEALPNLCPALTELQAACTYRDSYRLGAIPKKTDRDTDSISVFALVGFDVTDTLRVTGELRYMRDDITVSTNTAVDRVSQAILALPIDFGGYVLPARASQTSDTFNPRVTIDYRLTDDALVYLSAAKGTKPAGFGTSQFAVPEDAPIDQEQLWAYELGTKTQWLDNTLQANAALFFNVYTDRQVGITVTNQYTQFPSAGVTNAGEAQTKGLELDLVWDPIDFLTLGLGYAYTDAEFTDFNYSLIRKDKDGNLTGATVKDQAICGNPEGDCDGAPIAGVPEHSATVQAKYIRPLTETLEWFVNASGNYDSKRALSDQVNTAYVDSNFIFDTQVGIQADDWSLQLYVDNVFDDDTVRWAQRYNDFRDGMYGGTGGQPRDEVVFGFLPPPRVVGLRATYRFDGP